MADPQRSQVFRNVRILGTLAICFALGIFAAETVGGWLERNPVPDAASKSPGDADVKPPASADQLP